MLINTLNTQNSPPQQRIFQPRLSTVFEKPWPAVSERYKTGDVKDFKEVRVQLSYKLKAPIHRATSNIIRNSSKYGTTRNGLHN